MNSLIERYVFTVTSQISENQREDVAKELRATIEDMVADRSNGDGSEDADVKAVLEELGNPEFLAQQYSNAKQYLIGPQWFGEYKKLLITLLKFVPATVATIVLISSNFVGGDWNLISAITNAIGTGFNVAIMVTFWVTLVFFFLERSNEKPNQMCKEWKTEMLPELPKARQIPRIDTFFEILVNIGFIIFLFSLRISPQWYGSEKSVEILNPDMWKVWVPIVILLSALEIIHQIFKFIVGNWTRGLIITQVLLNIFTIILAIIFASTQSIINPEFISILESKGVENLPSTINWIVNIMVASVIAISLWEIVSTIGKGLKFKSQPHSLQAQTLE
jgi:hypothetical protein